MLATACQILLASRYSAHPRQLAPQVSGQQCSMAAAAAAVAAAKAKAKAKAATAAAAALTTFRFEWLPGHITLANHVPQPAVSDNTTMTADPGCRGLQLVAGGVCCKPGRQLNADSPAISLAPKPIPPLLQHNRDGSENTTSWKNCLPPF